MKIGLFNDLAIGEWEQHELFLDKMDSLLAEDACSWRREMDEKARQVTEEDRADFDEIRSDYSKELDDFKIILTNSSFVYSYSLFENSLIRMCRRSQDIHNSPHSIKSRAGILDAKKYMKKSWV